MSKHFLTKDIAGTGGSIKTSPEDFRVEEIPLYLPCGEGEHLYITVEKKGLTTHQLLRRCSELFAVKERDIGYAGLKDAVATTVQTISVPLLAPEAAHRLEDDRIRVLSASRHRNKLRPGHLAGNRFRIRIASPQSGSGDRAERILEVLGDRGVPNFFGEQRYGVLGNSHQIGRAILRGDYDQAVRLLIGEPDKIDHPQWQQAAILFREGKLVEACDLLPRHCRYERQVLASLNRGQSAQKAVLDLPRNILRLYLSAYQSSLFDRVVEMRLETLDRIWPGDIACKHANGACFRVTDVSQEQRRADSFEISATGPLYGQKMMLAGGQSGILEEALLDKEQLSLSTFRLGRGMTMPGERRPLRVPLSESSIETEGRDLVLAFVLPKGSYATSLLREVVKSGPF